MAGIPLSQGIDYSGTMPNFQRDYYKSLSALKEAGSDANKGNMPPMLLGLCKEDGKVYLYDKINNEEDTENGFGYWREFKTDSSSGGSGSGLSEQQLSQLMFQFVQLPTQSTEEFPIINGMKAFNLSDGKVYSATVDGEGNVTWNEVEKVNLVKPSVSVGSDGTVNITNSNANATLQVSFDGGTTWEDYDSTKKAAYNDVLVVKVEQNGIVSQSDPYTFNMPVPTVNINADAGTASVSGNYVDDVTIYYTTDGTEPTTESSVYSGDPIALSDGEDTITVKVVDGNGNAQTSTATYNPPKPSISIDNASGEATITTTSTVAGTVVKYGIGDAAVDTVYDSSNKPVLTDGQTIKAKITALGKDSAQESKSYNKVTPIYYGLFDGGVADVNATGFDITESDIKGLTSLDKTNKANNLSLGTAVDIAYAFPVYAYPAKLGNLSSIINNMNAEVLSDWVKLTKTVDGVVYNVYVQEASFGADAGDSFAFNFS
jgi:hypothetical protein